LLPLSDVVHLAITGIAQGCAYGLIALGFVLIYKATEVVNFAHGEFMMLGAFAVLAFTEALGWGFWPAFVLGCLSIAVVGYLVDATIMRRIIGESQASVFILTVAFGFIFRALAALEGIDYYEDPFGGPSLSFSATKHQGGDYLTFYQVQDGKWEIVEKSVPF
jgi:branched-chain amino acid transport system permease protein